MSSTMRTSQKGTSVNIILCERSVAIGKHSRMEFTLFPRKKYCGEHSVRTNKEKAHFYDQQVREVWHR
jgi:hypothetical protein